MLNSPSTQFVTRLRANDQAAWFELWETFGPVLRAQLTKWGRGRIGAETVRDLSQETLAALSDSIDRFDPTRGARFSTWLLAIAKHVLGDEIDRRMALKRGAGKAAASLDETWMKAAPGESVDAAYEAAVFRAKVEAAVRQIERKSEFLDFEIFRMRVLEGRPGKEVASAVGVSEPTVSRRLAKVRVSMRSAISQTISQYSFTQEELAEAERNGLTADPNASPEDRASASGSAPAVDRDSDQMFDEALAEIYHRQQELRRQDELASQD
ncbi:MAG: sigma-70 family RNA polymerase sigma factor [Planctomycetota bacterium]